MYKIFVTAVFFIFSINLSQAQHLSLKNDRAFQYENSYINEKNNHLSIKPLFFKNYNALLDSLNSDSLRFPALMNKAAFIVQDAKSFMSINSVLISDNRFNSSEKGMQFVLGGGLSLRANKDNRFYSDIAIYGFSSNYFAEQIQSVDSFHVIPHYGTSSIKRQDRYYAYEADLRFTFKPADYIAFETGKSRHFFGYGTRSLFLSDISNSMPFVSTNVNVWKLEYRWMILQAKDYNLTLLNISTGLKKKYIALHYLSINLTKRINLNFFEAVVTNPYDQLGRKGLDMHYLNPVIFYRPVEFAAGTYDNALFGLGLNIRIFKKFYLFSQILIDDMIISEMKAGNGWWGNKYGGQFGAKGYDFWGMKNLFVSGEINLMRPYAYSHGRDNISYTNHRLPLAHPAGANFAEAVFTASYSKDRFLYSFQMQALIAGVDSSDVSYGGDILKSYDLKLDAYGNTFLQGEKAGDISADAYVSFLINPKMDISFKVGGKYTAHFASAVPEHGIQFYLALSSSVFYSEE